MKNWHPTPLQDAYRLAQEQLATGSDECWCGMDLAYAVLKLAKDKSLAECAKGDIERSLHAEETKYRELQRQLSALQSMKDRAVEFIEDIVTRSKGHGINVPVLVDQAESVIETIKKMPTR